ncbi:hypothetical protein COCHEDRAFT_1219020 [Bipolaris maydis C5]|uniref:Uncharacterized protein n=1 Tax=Cochliobolus heterostrophus (strain C5 / ATCC 48332 / race O) TaxID=701091 RepID=M2SK09_COCH5|nr:hypothetical protein COCHEDRAFT_1219020 [Bipolaris maydis C5]KAJ6208575.1 hypothetical protein PSV09DRAFT_1219020 [Bipolaris maydis]
MRWIFKFISDNPDVQKKLFESLRSFHAAAVTEDHLPTHSEICNASIPYLDAVVEESLPLSHTAIFQDRECTEDAIILGHYIPKGAHTMMIKKAPASQSQDWISKKVSAVRHAKRQPKNTDFEPGMRREWTSFILSVGLCWMIMAERSSIR